MRDMIIRRLFVTVWILAGCATVCFAAYQNGA